MSTFVLYHTINNSKLHNTYYIKIDFTNDSEIKAKNLLSSYVFDILMDSMGITDKTLIDDNKKAMIKAIKSNIYDSGLESLENDNRFKLIEVTGNIKKTVVKTETIQRRISENGIKKVVDAQGIKYNSSVYSNIEFYIVADEEIKHRYYLIEKTTGLSTVTVKSKDKKVIEDALQRLNMSEKQLLKAIDNTVKQYGIDETKQITKTSNNSDSTAVKSDNTITNIIDSTIQDKSYIVGNRAFKDIIEAEKYCNECDFDYSMIIVQDDTIKNPIEKTDIKNSNCVTGHEKSCNDKQENKITTYTEFMTAIKLIDKQIDILENEYEHIQADRKLKGLSLAIYKCTDKQALQLIKIDKRITELEHEQDDIKKEYVKNNSIEYKKQNAIMVKTYNNYKYKVVLNHNKENAIYTNNFHEAIKPYYNDAKTIIQVFKLLYLNMENKLPYEIMIYNKFINQWDKIEENRYYYSNSGYLLEKQLYYNSKLINKFIYRGNNDIMFYGYNTNNAYMHINNIRGNYGVEIIKDADNIKTVTNTNIAMLKYVKGITREGYNLINKIKNKYKNDKYIKINELIPV